MCEADDENPPPLAGMFRTDSSSLDTSIVLVLMVRSSLASSPFPSVRERACLRRRRYTPPCCFSGFHAGPGQSDLITSMFCEFEIVAGLDLVFYGPGWCGPVCGGPIQTQIDQQREMSGGTNGGGHMPPSVQANASLKETIMKDHRFCPAPCCMPCFTMDFFEDRLGRPVKSIECCCLWGSIC